MWKIKRTSVSQFVFVACLVQGYGSAQSESRAPAKPSITLIVAHDTVDVLRKNGSTYFTFDARASDGFSGTVSGSITVSQPANGDGVELAEGLEGKNISFTLAAGQKLSETQSPENLKFHVRTARTNPTNGQVIYSVFLNPSRDYESIETPRIVTVRVVTGEAP
jgi:hypothetical protein